MKNGSANSENLSHRTRFKKYIEKNPLFFAPMSGYSENVERRICRAFGAGVLFTWLVNENVIVNPNLPKPLTLKFKRDEHPIAVQLFGSDPKKLGLACKICEDMGFDAIDLNACCPDKHIIKKGAGGALLKNLDNLTRILETMRKTTELPLSLKFRSGFDTENPVHLEILDIATQSELDMLIFHPASISHGRSGKSNWKLIKELKDRSRILIVGNGDIKSADDVFRMKEETGCDGIMIGRAGISHPWIFAYATHRLKNMAQIPLRIIIMDAYNKLSSNHLLSGIESDIDGILEFALLHLELLENEYGPLAQYFAIKEIPPYINGFASAKELRVKLYNTGGNIKKMRKLIQEFKDIMGRRLWDEVS